MITKRTLLGVLVGITIGLILSPLMWLQFTDPLVLSGQCTGGNQAVQLSWSPSQAIGIVKRLVNVSQNDSWMSSFLQYSHNRSQLSRDELERTVTSQSDSNVRYRKLASELAPRKLLLVGVVTAVKYLETRATGIYNTWGREMSDLYFFASQPDDKNLGLPIITLPGINDTQYPPQRKVYHMLKYMHDHYIDEYDFFMRSDDDVYVKTDLLLELLQSINPAQDIYMGCPGFGRPDDRNRIKLEENEHYCMGGPGVIFSRSALRKLAPHLDSCLESVVVSYNEDVEVGRCVSKMLQLQCTWAWETSIIFWTDYKKILATEELYTSDSVKMAITLHPLKDPKLMYRVHQYVQELKLKRLMQDVSVVQGDIERITHLVPDNRRHFKLKRWLWYDISSNPSSRYDIATWEYFNSTRLFLAYEHMPVIGLPNRFKIGINNALEVLLEIMNEREGNSHPFIPPYHLYDGFSVADHSSGIEYILHMSVHRQGSTEPLDYIANIFLPYQGAGMVTYQKSSTFLEMVVNIIINVGQSTDLSNFLQMYEEVCLRHKLKAHLHIVMFGKNNKVLSRVSQLLARHPQEHISTYELSSSAFSYSKGFSHVASLLEDDDLMVFFDYGFVFTADFLDHCRMNTIKGKQVYFPILFSFYKPDLVQQHLQRPLQMLISADTGFFLRYNYQVVSIFKSDFTSVGGFTDSAKSNSHLNDDVKFVDKVLSTDIYAMRALEPYLRRHYRPRTCKGLSGNAHLACMNSRADAIGSKKILGSLLVSHDLLDKI